MNRIEFVNIIKNRPDTIEKIQENFINFMALYNLISSYNISVIDMDNCTFTITFDRCEDTNQIFNVLPSDMYMYNTILNLEKSISGNSIIIKIS